MTSDTVFKYFPELTETQKQQIDSLLPLYKEWTIKVALKVFFGLDPKNELKEINKAITNIVKAAASLHTRLGPRHDQAGADAWRL